MTPSRLGECLRLIRWERDVVAKALDVPSETVGNWLSGGTDVPRKVGAWLEALCFVHEAAEETKPSTVGEGFGEGPRQEYIPVYAYNLLRNLNHGPVLLKSLFGSDDEGAVFFLVSRGLATREADHLIITEGGRNVGSMSANAAARVTSQTIQVLAHRVLVARNLLSAHCSYPHPAGATERPSRAR